MCLAVVLSWNVVTDRMMATAMTRRTQAMLMDGVLDQHPR